MKIPILVAVLAASFSTTVFAEAGDKYECTIGDLNRRVEIMYETGMTMPCEVHYFKDTEAPGESQVLWRAMNEEGYCEAKVAAFIEKLQSSGWTCTGGGDNHDTAEPDTDASESADDTVELGPAGDHRLNPDQPI